MHHFVTLLPWQEGKPLAWNVTVICPLAVSYVSGYSLGASAELAASRKCEKYANLPNSNIFQPIVFANVGTLNSSAVALISALGARSAPSLMIYLNTRFFSSSLLQLFNVLTPFFYERISYVIK